MKSSILFGKRLFWGIILLLAPMLWGSANLTAQEANTFLYRISGNGLSKPSFIWGTIHVNDQQVFNFPDSLYRFLEQSEVFAMEIHPDSIAEKAMAHFFSKKRGKTIGETVDAATLQRLKKKHQSQLSQPLEKMTVAEVMMEQKMLVKGKTQTSNMGTFMDMYLMVLSRSMGKKIMGLEQVEDQLNLLDQLVAQQNPEYMLNDFAAPKTTQLLIKAYAAGNMNAVLKMVNTLPPAVEVPFLSARNKTMMENLIPAMQQASVFTAVGAAHLPGNMGLLKMLQQQGYTVTPVFGKQALHASQYKPPTEGYATNNEWYVHQVPEEGYAASFPGKPATNDLKGSGFKMHTYIDWATTTYYYVMHVAAQVTITDENRDSMLVEAANASSKNSNGKNAPFVRTVPYKKDLLAKETVFSSKEKSTIRMVLVNNDQDLYMLLIATMDSANLYTSSANRFLQSLTLMPRQASAFSWYQDDEAQFKVLMPGTPQINPEGMQSNQDDDDVNEKTIYRRVDGTGNELLIKVVHNANGYLPAAQRLMQDAMQESIKSMSDKGSTQIKDITWLGRNVQQFIGKMSGNLVYEMRNIVRGSRLYSVWYFDNQKAYSAARADTFFSSFTFLPYPSATVKAQRVNDVTLGYFSDSVTYETNYADEVDSSQMKAYNPALDVWFTAKRSTLSPFAWATSDSALLAAMLPAAKNEDNPVEYVQQQFQQQQGLPSLMIVKKEDNGNSWSRIQMLKSGTEIITLSVHTDSLGIQHPSVSDWFSTFKMHNNADYIDVSRRSAKTVFDSLRSCSNDQFEEWVRGLDKLPFTKSDLPLLLSEVHQTWDRDTVGYPSLQLKLWQIIEDIADASHLPLLQNAYHTADSNSMAQGKIVSLLLKMNNANALAFVQTAVPLTRQKEVYTGEIFGNFYNKLQPAQQLLPGWFHLLSDTLYGPAVLNTYLMLADSNMAPTQPTDMPEKILALSKHYLNVLSQPGHDYYSYINALPKYLASLKSPDADAMLFDFTIKPVEENYFRYNALEYLTGNGVFPAQSIQSVAAVPALRYSVYNLLKKTNREADFPAVWATQAAIGEAYLYELADEDYDTPTIELAAERELLFMGKKYRFFVYKLTLTYDDEKEVVFAVAGPFDLNKKQLDILLPDVYVSNISEEDFEKRQIDKWLTKYLKEIEESEKETLAPDEED